MNLTNKEKLEELKGLARKHCVAFISSIVLDDPKFAICSGSAKKEHHHYYDEGLLEHTWEVTMTALRSNEVLGYPADERLLFLAGIFHDIGKIYDYEKVTKISHKENSDMRILVDEWCATLHKDLIGHLSRSAIIWSKAAERFDFDEDETEQVLHAILGHHGLREWGSPSTPKTPMAWLLHCADQMSARVNESRSK